MARSPCWPAAATPRWCGTAPRRGSRSTRTGASCPHCSAAYAEARRLDVAVHRMADEPVQMPAVRRWRPCSAGCWRRRAAGSGPRRRCGSTRRSGPTGSPAPPRPRCCAPSSTPWTGCAPAAAASSSPAPDTAIDVALTVAARLRPRPGVRDRPGAPDGVRGGRAGAWGCRCGASTSRWWTCGRRDAACSGRRRRLDGRGRGPRGARRGGGAAPISPREPFVRVTIAVRLGDNCRDVAAGRAAWCHPHVGENWSGERPWSRSLWRRSSCADATTHRNLSVTGYALVTMVTRLVLGYRRCLVRRCAAIAPAVVCARRLDGPSSTGRSIPHTSYPSRRPDASCRGAPRRQEAHLG